MSETVSRRLIVSGLGAAGLAGCARSDAPTTRLLNVSYDPTREFYAAFNARFVPEWAQAHRRALRIDQSGARGATMSFAQRQLGDVLIAWENEALLSREQLAGQVEIVRPSFSILAEPPVAVVDKVVDAHGTRAVAQAYLEALWRDWAQDLGARNFFRPRVAAVTARWSSQFPNLPMATIADFGGWEAAQQRFFADGGVFDQITGHFTETSSPSARR